RFLSLPEFLHVEVRALTYETMIGQDFPDLGPFGQSGELRVTEWGAQLDTLNPQVRHLLHQAGEIPFEHRAVWICLTADWESERIGVEIKTPGGHEPGRHSIRRHFLEELSSRILSHTHLLFYLVCTLR